MHYKSACLLYTLFFIAPCGFFAQEIGLTIGGGLSQYNFQHENAPGYISQYEAYKHSPILSAQLGTEMKFKIIENLDWTVGVNYAMRGDRERTTFNSYVTVSPDSTTQTKSDASVRLHYIDVPVLLHFSKLHLFIGAQVAYLAAVTVKSDYTETMSYQGNTWLVDEQHPKGSFDLSAWPYYNRVDFGVVAGAGIPLSDRLQLAVRVYQGLNGVLKQDYFIQFKNFQSLLSLSYCLNAHRDN